MYLRTINGLGQPVSRRRREAKVLDRLRKKGLVLETEINGEKLGLKWDPGWTERPYIPGHHPESREYYALPHDERAKVAAIVNRLFKEATTIDRKLDPHNPKDKPFVRTWLKLRDLVMSFRVKRTTSAVLVSSSNPLPASEFHRLEAAVRDLEQKVSATQDPRKQRFQCWIQKLKDPGVDDRIIGWGRICPATSGAVGAAFAIGPCDLTQGTPVDQAALERSIRTEKDVEAANQSLHFIIHMRSAIVVAHEMTSLPLENLRRDTDDAGRAIENLDKWANAPLGGSSAMPPAYRAIKDWIMRRQKDPKSLYNCH